MGARMKGDEGVPAAIPDELRAAFDAGAWHEAIIPHLADSVHIEHRPVPGPADGAMDANALAAQMRGDHYGVLRDPVQVLESVRVEGNVMHVVKSVDATLPNGEAISIPLIQEFMFRDGRLSSIVDIRDPEVEAVLRDALEP
jgi:hypothetical protein